MAKTWKIDARHPLFEQQLAALSPEELDMIAGLVTVLRRDAAIVPPLNADGVRMIKSAVVARAPIRIFYRLQPDGVAQLLWVDADDTNTSDTTEEKSAQGRAG